MTLHDVASQLHNLTAGRINGERWSLTQTQRYLHNWLVRIPAIEGKAQAEQYLTVTLPDGEWLAKAERLAGGEYDYTIPDTREQESRLWAEMLARSAQ